MTFHIEFELPLLDSKRRQFLMHRRHESLVELLPSGEDELPPLAVSSVTETGNILKLYFYIMFT